MRRIWNKRLLALILCGALLLGLCGCQKKTKQLDHLPLDGEAIAYLESLYGVAQEEIWKEMGLSEKNFTHQARGLWSIDKPIVVAGKEFTKTLKIDTKSDQFYGINYYCSCDSVEEVAEVAETICSTAAEHYGLPKVKAYSGLYEEGVFEKIRNSKMGSWSSAWAVGDFSYVTMLASVDAITAEKESYVIKLDYQVLPEEWHRFDPEFQSPVHPLGPALRGEIEGAVEE